MWVDVQNRLSAVQGIGHGLILVPSRVERSLVEDRQPQIRKVYDVPVRRQLCVALPRIGGAVDAGTFHKHIKDALDEEKKTVKEKIAQMSAEMYDRQNIGVISGYRSKWDDISIDDKLTVVDTLIGSIHVGHGKVKIAWKI